MSRSIHPQEREIVHVLEQALLSTIDRVRRQVLCAEFRMSREVHCVGDLVVAKPVADPVGVTCPD